MKKFTHHASRRMVKMRERLTPFLIRFFIATLIAWMLATVPLPRLTAQQWFAYIQIPIIIFLLVCYIGKLLIDSFFYNHYNS
ncbi:MAG: hypothetical protein HZC40_07575 [Chloroflexi bacterium]|nr:hypothetical protein [Chloroflexota bacterium]